MYVHNIYMCIKIFFSKINIYLHQTVKMITLYNYNEFIVLTIVDPDSRVSTTRDYCGFN